MLQNCGGFCYSQNMTVTQQGRLDAADKDKLLSALIDYEAASAWYREVVLEMIDKSSYREVARLTGLSTNTLQRWKREAGK